MVAGNRTNLIYRDKVAGKQNKSILQKQGGRETEQIKSTETG